MLNAEQLLMAEMKASPLNTKPKILVSPGSNPWTKYFIIGGIICVSLLGAYLITKTNKNLEDETSKN